MDEENIHNQEEMITSIKFANEFLKIARGAKKELEHENHLPDEIVVHLANEQLKKIIEDFKLDPEMLVWGMVSILEIVLRYAELSAEELGEVLDKFIEWKEREKNGN